jgi:cyclophilin family peptidyl-prolyl cis-trans isomerase
MTRSRTATAVATALALSALAPLAGGSTAAGASAGCSAAAPPKPAVPRTFSAPPKLTIDRAARYTATVDTTCGPIVIALNPRAAPLAVNNFVFLARKRFYDGLNFHRAVRGFVIQGGDPAGNGTGGPGYDFRDELPKDGYPPGSVAMANSGPNTNGSQFFIVTGDASGLPNDYSKFGRVTKGFAVARRIEALGTADQTLRRPVWIRSVRISVKKE